MTSTNGKRWIFGNESISDIIFKNFPLQVEKLSVNSGLQTVYLEYNAVAKDPQYRRKLKLVCPSLTQIDATLCK